MSTIIPAMVNHLRSGHTAILVSSIATGVTGLLGHSVVRSLQSIGFWHGFAFGAVAMATTSLCYFLLDRMCIQNKYINLLLSGTAGGLAAFGISAAMASAGIVSSPVSIPLAITMSVVSIASLIFELHFTFDFLDLLHVSI